MRPLRRSFTALIALGIGAVAAAPYLAPGRLDGVVTLSSRLTAIRQRVRIYDEPGAVPAPAPADDGPLANLVLYLDSVPAPTEAPDPIYHNVFSLSRARTFDLGRYPQGHSKTVRFQTPGVVQVFCQIHADMSGFILVLDYPYFTVPDATGRYGLDDIAHGEYRLVAWHERIRPITTDVRIESRSVTRLDLHIPLPEPAR